MLVLSLRVLEGKIMSKMKRKHACFHSHMQKTKDLFLLLLPVPGELRSSPSPSPEPNSQNHAPDSGNHDVATTSTTTRRSNRPARVCAIRAVSRLCSALQNPPATERKATKKEKRREYSQSPLPSPPPQLQQCSKVFTPLVEPPMPMQLPRWNLRCMWELASILNFLHLFRPFLNISLEFSAEEFESALLTPNDTLGDTYAFAQGNPSYYTNDTHTGYLDNRVMQEIEGLVALGNDILLVSKLIFDDMYFIISRANKTMKLKCRLLMQDIKSYIVNSLKHSVHLSTFRKERVGGDSHDISYWYEDDPTIGHRLYREIRKTKVVQLKKAKTRGDKLFSSKNRTEANMGKKLKIDMLPEIEKDHKVAMMVGRSSMTVLVMVDLRCWWGGEVVIGKWWCLCVAEIVASCDWRWGNKGEQWCYDSGQRQQLEHDGGNMVLKRKEKLLKKQQRQALLDTYMVVDRLPHFVIGNQLPTLLIHYYVLCITVLDHTSFFKNWVFYDYNQSINEAIKIIKQKQASPEHRLRRESEAKHEASLTNGKLSDPSHAPEHQNFGTSSPKLSDSDYDEEEHQTDVNRLRKRPTRYSEKEFIEEVLDEADFDSDDDIVGEAVYDEEYIEKHKQRRKLSSGSEGDEEYQQKQASPEHRLRRESEAKHEASLTNGKLSDPSHAPEHQNFGTSSPKLSDSDYDEEEHQTDVNRLRKRPTRYSEKEFIEEVLDEADFDSDDDIVGEAVYDEEYIEKHKQRRKLSSGSEGDEEYQWDVDNIEEEEEEDYDDDDDDDDDDEDEGSSSISEDSDKPHKSNQLQGRTRRETRRRSVDEMQSGIRRSNRSTRNRINYQQYEVSESETEFIKPDTSNVSADQSDASQNGEYMMESEDSDDNDFEDQEMKVEDEPATTYPE
ncbi:hypothetical protein TanjilG_29105 [Lupinus angustifolius]|uniref:DDT domain-containing protein n=1 Tax=Lupinus angustifolius TaxID=3871 RepID=A0A1J7HI56_LUPAN|nr:hypothetical protein TanjilG_29105 [Lupinus angustifolius]